MSRGFTEALGARSRRGFVLLWSALFGLSSFLLPATAGVVLGHEAFPTCDTLSNDYGLTATVYLTSDPNGTTPITTIPPRPASGPDTTAIVPAGSYWVRWSDGYTQGLPTSNRPTPLLDVGKCSPTITTVASPDTGAASVGATFGDTATFSGAVAFSSGSSVTFSLHAGVAPSACAGTALVSGSGAISGNSASWSTAWTPPSAGTYTWGVSFAGDAYNNSFSACGGANETVSLIPPPTPGDLTLAKSLTGGPEGYTGPFTIHYVCGSATTGDAVVSAGSSVTIPNIPADTSCTVTEPTLPTAPSGYSFGTPTVSPANGVVTIPSDSSVTVTTTNTLSLIPPPTCTVNCSPSSNPGLSLTKGVSLSQSGPFQDSVTTTTGTTVWYQIVVKNTGDVAMGDLTITDTLGLPASCPAIPNPFAVGATWTCTYARVAAEGTTVNTATAKGAGATASDNATVIATTPATPTPTGGVAGATATPKETLPPTDSANGQASSSPGVSFGLILLVLAGITAALGLATPVPARIRRRDRRA